MGPLNQSLEREPVIPTSASGLGRRQWLRLHRISQVVKIVKRKMAMKGNVRTTK